MYKDAEYAGGIGTAFHSFVPATREGRGDSGKLRQVGCTGRAVRVVHAMREAKHRKKQRLLPAGSGGSNLGQAGSQSAMSSAEM